MLSLLTPCTGLVWGLGLPPKTPIAARGALVSRTRCRLVRPPVKDCCSLLSWPFKSESSPGSHRTRRGSSRTIDGGLATLMPFWGGTPCSKTFCWLLSRLSLAGNVSTNLTNSDCAVTSASTSIALLCHISLSSAFPCGRPLRAGFSGPRAPAAQFRHTALPCGSEPSCGGGLVATSAAFGGARTSLAFGLPAVSLCFFMSSRSLSCEVLMNLRRSTMSFTVALLLPRSMRTSSMKSPKES
mmetsp:Transcript_73547/g.239384  ORF Transcript_73547/g.239384 Transcript_73547/m.239384 type:complete len:241 (+) Transcript_73547:141-863(+)